MNHPRTFICTLIIIALSCISISAAKPPTVAQQAEHLRLRLEYIAQQCTDLALKYQPDSIRYQELLTMSTAVLHAARSLAMAPDDSHEYEQLCDQLARALTPYTSILTRSQKKKDRDDIDPITLPLADIVSMIEEEQVELHLRPSSVQLSAKRIIFRSIVELFNSFGKSKLSYQEKIEKREYSAAHMRHLIEQHNRSRQKVAETKLFNAFIRVAPEKRDLAAKRIQRFFRAHRSSRTGVAQLGSYLKKELWDERSLMALRTVRILSNRFIDKVIPNPKRKKWQQFAEMLVPLVIGHVLAFIISKAKSERWSALASTIVNDIVIRLIMVQFYMEKKNVAYFMLMGIGWLLAFYNSETSNNLWHSLPNEPHHAGHANTSGFFSKRAAFCSHMMSKDNALDVAIDGISSLVLYKIIDDVVMPRITIPRWLLATPVCPQSTAAPHD